LIYDGQEENANDDEDVPAHWTLLRPKFLWLNEYLVQVRYLEDVNLDDFWDYAYLRAGLSAEEYASLEYFWNDVDVSAEENEAIKKMVLDFILYFYGFGVDFNDISHMIDVEASRLWRSQHWNLDIDDVGSVLDDVIGLKRGAEDRGDTLTDIYANFMMHLKFIGENNFEIIAPFYTTERRYTLSFHFQRIDGKFVVVSIGFV